MKTGFVYYRNLVVSGIISLESKPSWNSVIFFNGHMTRIRRVEADTSTPLVVASNFQLQKTLIGGSK